LKGKKMFLFFNLWRWPRSY